jgi:hypothetical protein
MPAIAAAYCKGSLLVLSVTGAAVHHCHGPGHNEHAHVALWWDPQCREALSQICVNSLSDLKVVLLPPSTPQYPQIAMSHLKSQESLMEGLDLCRGNTLTSGFIFDSNHRWLMGTIFFLIFQWPPWLLRQVGYLLVVAPFWFQIHPPDILVTLALVQTGIFAFEILWPLSYNCDFRDQQ